MGKRSSIHEAIKGNALHADYCLQNSLANLRTKSVNKIQNGIPKLKHRVIVDQKSSLTSFERGGGW